MYTITESAVEEIRDAINDLDITEVVENVDTTVDELVALLTEGGYLEQVVDCEGKVNECFSDDGEELVDQHELLNVTVPRAILRELFNKTNNPAFDRFIFESPKDQDSIVISTCTDDDWEYAAIGIGQDDRGVFVVCLADLDGGYQTTQKHRCNSSFKDCDSVFELGVELGIFEEVNDVKYTKTSDTDDDGAAEYNKFLEMLK